jgi:hypothetical protein
MLGASERIRYGGKHRLTLQQDCFTSRYTQLAL